MAQRVGTTDLRQRLTDILQAVREQRAAYVVETFGRPQAALVNLDEYEQFQRFRREREAFLDWLEDAAARDAEQNVGLSDEQVLEIIEQALALPEDRLVELARYIEFLRFKAQHALALQERLAKDYAELAAHYDELAAELADEIWLPLENEALAGVEKDMGS